MRRSAGLSRWFDHQTHGCMSPEEHVIELLTMLSISDDASSLNLYEDSAPTSVSYGPGTLWLAEELAGPTSGPVSSPFLSANELLNPGLAT